MNAAIPMENSEPFSRSDTAFVRETRTERQITIVVEELAEVFRRSEEATILVEKAGFPRTRIPAFVSPLMFWTIIADEARSGAIHGGLQPILEAAAQMYPANPIFAKGLGRTSGSSDGFRLPMPSPFMSRLRPRPSRWLWRVSVVALLFTAFMLYRPSQSIASIVACTVRIEGSARVGKGWVMQLDSGEIYSVDINGSSVSFRCPSDGCRVAVVVDLHSGEIRHWESVEVSSGEQPLVSLDESKAGFPESFIERGISQGAIEPGQLEAYVGTNQSTADDDSVSSTVSPKKRKRKYGKRKLAKSMGKVKVSASIDDCQVSLGSKIVSCHRQRAKTIAVKPGEYAVRWRQSAQSKWLDAGPVRIQPGVIINLDLMQEGLRVTTRREYHQGI